MMISAPYNLGKKSAESAIQNPVMVSSATSAVGTCYLPASKEGNDNKQVRGNHCNWCSKLKM